MSRTNTGYARIMETKGYFTGLPTCPFAWWIVYGPEEQRITGSIPASLLYFCPSTKLFGSHLEGEAADVKI